MNEVKIIKDQILAILRRGLNSSADVNILAKYCFGISKSYLQSKFNNIYKLEYYEQYTLDEIALDSIVPLFEKRKGDFEFIIIRSFKNWRNPIEDNINADYFVHKIVWNRTEQQITKVYREIDPFFAKIYDSVKYLIKISELQKISYFGQILIVKDRKGNYRNIIDKDNFDTIPTHIFDRKLNNILFSVLNYLEESTEFSTAIPINLLVKKLKILKINEFSEFEYYEGNSELILEESEIAVEKIINDGLIKTFSKLENINSNNKYNSDEFSNFKNVLINFAADLTNGGIQKSTYEYFLEICPGLSSDIFYEKYQNTIYYLMNDLKKQISKKINREIKKI